jgi:CheY-like chemotaxis protein
MKILITDDLYTNRLLAAIAIKALGHVHDEAVNGEDALKKLKENHYDLILMDIEMPVMNGIETTQFIRNNFDNSKKNTPIIAITAHDPGELTDHYMRMGFNGYISKPITREKLETYLPHIKKPN